MVLQCRGRCADADIAQAALGGLIQQPAACGPSGKLRRDLGTVYIAPPPLPCLLVFEIRGNIENFRCFLTGQYRCGRAIGWALAIAGPARGVHATSFLPLPFGFFTTQFVGDRDTLPGAVSSPRDLARPRVRCTGDVFLLVGLKPPQEIPRMPVSAHRRQPRRPAQTFIPRNSQTPNDNGSCTGVACTINRIFWCKLWS